VRPPKCIYIGVFFLGLMCVAVINTHAQQQSSLAGQQASTGADPQRQDSTPSQQPDKGHQNSPDMADMQMPTMQHAAMNMNERPKTFVEEVEQHATSGTSAEPNSTPLPMLMTMKGSWTLMFHAVAFLNVLQQTGPRGADKVFSTNWLMPMAQRRLGPGTFTARTMLSFEPATITGRYYPELFQQGETAFGKPIVDGQHPHNFFMELAALYDLHLGEKSLLSFYVAPVGDPAMGPTAYPHRASASEDPIAPLGHHLEDSTHISYDVITVGITHKILRLEASGFHGREPDENRWTIEAGTIDSWSTRLTVQPGQNWSGQYSFAHLTSPEALRPDEDIQRMTASLMYNRPLAHGNWASTLVWGRNRVLQSGLVWNGYLAESTLRFAQRNYIWGRIENVDRTNELLLKNEFEPPDLQESIIGRVQAYTAGYDHDFALIPHLATALGAQITLYSTPATLTALYGSHPVGAVAFVRLRPFGKQR
jgi:hypothetical protein